MLDWLLHSCCCVMMASCRKSLQIYGAKNTARLMNTIKLALQKVRNRQRFTSLVLPSYTVSRKCECFS